MPDAHAAAAPRARTAREKLVHEVTRFGLMFFYLWLVLGLFVLHEWIIRGEMGLDYQAQGLAVINALVLAKVMLVAEDLEVDRGLRSQPIALMAVGEAALFAVVFLVFHILEALILGMLHGSTLARSVPHIGGGGFAGLAIVTTIMFVMLTPYFAFRDIARALGPGELRKLLFSGNTDVRPPAARR